MMLNGKVGIVGGDLRQVYAAKKLQEDGNKVEVCGFENISKLPSSFKVSSLSDVVLGSKYIIFPVPVSRDKIHINSPFASTSIKMDEALFSMLKNKVVFGGIISSLMERVKHLNFFIKDYYNREDFMILNAIPTAEGSVKIALNESNCTIFGSNVLVVGYGRIGKVLSKLLKSMGAKVTVSSRNFEEIAWAKVENFEVINLAQINHNLNFDIIFNTVPAPIINYKIMSLLKPIPLIIDLASLPGGVDKNVAEKLGIKVIHALGIPGKYFPKSAGEIIVEILYKIIREEGL